MKKSRFSEEQIVGILQEAEKGSMSQAEICHENGVSQSTFYIWKRKCADMAQEDLGKLRDLERDL